MSIRGVLTEMFNGGIKPQKCPSCGDMAYGLDMNRRTGCDQAVWGMCHECKVKYYKKQRLAGINLPVNQVTVWGLDTLDRRVYQSKPTTPASILWQMGERPVNLPAYFKKHKALECGRFIYSLDKKYIEKLSKDLPFVYYTLAYTYGGKPNIYIKPFVKHEYDLTLEQLLKIGQSKKPVKIELKSYTYLGANTKATVYCSVNRAQLEKMKAKMPNKVIKKEQTNIERGLIDEENG